MWDTILLTYEGSIEVKCNKLSLLVRKYEMFNMDKNENMQCMFEQFQTILDELIYLRRHYDNFDYIDKIMRILHR